ncbi:hypothetical protein BE21_18280 [Sorangium cellulosum]|uniref:Uncharacterized protein n=1 Tax=Sorangium cellulosum TaxID=56 RepID=A0A150TXS1_SORCE|nr:hypothetical protein BE21_18280 [Sorangium cellulosum]
MRAVLQSLTGLLERAEIIHPEASVRGYIGDQPVTFEIKTKSVGSMTLKWTEAHVPIHAGLDLLLSIRPSTPRDEREVARGDAVDHRLGDPAFDAAFIVEGAPERLVREIMDEEVRRGLLALTPDHVFTGPGALILQMPAWVDEAERAALLVRTAARLGAACAEIARRQLADVGRVDASGYRGEVAPGTRARDREELDALKRTMERRDEARGRAAKRLAMTVLFGVIAVVVLAFVVLAAITSRCTAGPGSRAQSRSWILSA